MAHVRLLGQMHACHDRALAVTAMFKASSANPYGCDASTCTLRTGDVVDTLPLAQAVVYLDLAYRHVPPPHPALSLPLCLSASYFCLSVCLSVCLSFVFLPTCLSPLLTLSPPLYHLSASPRSPFLTHSTHATCTHAPAPIRSCAPASPCSSHFLRQTAARIEALAAAGRPVHH